MHAPYEVMGIWWPRLDPGGAGARAALPHLTALAVPGWRLAPDGRWRRWAARGAAALREAARGTPVLAAASPADPAALPALLRDGEARRRVARQVAARVRREGAAGLLLDLPAAPAPAGDDLNAWVEELAWELRRVGALLAVAADPQVRDPEPGEPAPAPDYRVLGAYADRVVIRGFGFRGDGPPPHATAPLGWLQSALEYALGAVPARALLLGLPLFAPVWREGGGPARRRPLRGLAAGDAPLDAATLARRVAGRDRRGPWVAWADDAETLAEKAALVARYDAGGIALFGVGGEPDGLWAAVWRRLGLAAP